MCGTCGCGQDANGVSIKKPGEKDGSFIHKHDQDHHHHHHDHSHEHSHHDHHQPNKTLIELERDVLQNNQVLAARNRGYFEAKNIFAINLVSSPGSGKTSLLEKTLRDLKSELDFSVIEGDQQSMNDAERIGKLGVPVVQVNTGKGCHLESDMIYNAVKKINPKQDSVLMIENVGNLVCPSLFDLGESKRVVVMSITEGEDKPLKYPDMFLSSHVCIINKVDLLPHLNIDMEKIREYALRINPNLVFFEVSAIKGDGMEEWYQWLKSNL